MPYMTDRKKALGLGSSKTGTDHFWAQTVSSVALLVLMPLFVITIAPVLGQPHDVVIAHLSTPFRAVVVGLTLVVGWMHFIRGAQVAIEDYVKGGARKISIIILTCIGYGLIAASLYGVLRLAL